jgi:hypothetical protein
LYEIFRQDLIAFDTEELLAMRGLGGELFGLAKFKHWRGTADALA